MEDGETIVEELLIPFFKSDEQLDYSFNELDEEALETAGCEYWIDSDDKTMFVAENDGELVGFISAVEVDEPPIYVRENRVHIDGVYVKNRFRRRGIATRLIERIEEWAEDRGRDFLGVSAHKNNKASQGLYNNQFQLKFLSYRKRLESSSGLES